MDAKLIVAILLPSVFVLSILVMLVLALIRERRKNKEAELQAMQHLNHTSNAVTLTKETFTSPKYENYGISLPIPHDPYHQHVLSSPSAALLPSTPTKFKAESPFLPPSTSGRLHKPRPHRHLRRPSSSSSTSSTSSTPTYPPNTRPPSTPPHYSTFTSRNSRSNSLDMGDDTRPRVPPPRKFGTAATSMSIVLPPNALNMHETDVNSRSTLNLSELVPKSASHHPQVGKTRY